MAHKTIAQIVALPLDLIDAGDNDRTHFDANALEELAQSLREKGLKQPITVRPMGERYQIVAGERRFRAARLAGWTSIPAHVEAMSDEDASEVMLLENLARADLSPIEEATAFRKRLDAGWTVERLTQATGKKAGYINDRLRLLELAPEIQHLVRFGNLSLSFAQTLSRLDHNRQRIAVRTLNLTPNMGINRWRELVNTLYSQQLQESQSSMFGNTLELVQQIVDAAERPAKGRAAVTGALAGRHLPPVEHSVNDRGMARIFDRYILALHGAGLGSEASAVANIYNLFVALGWVPVPADALLPQLSPEATAGSELHVISLDS